MKLIVTAGPASRATVPVTTKIPAPIEAPTPIRMRSKRPRRRIRPSPGVERLEVRDLARRAEVQKWEKHEGEDEEAAALLFCWTAMSQSSLEIA